MYICEKEKEKKMKKFKFLVVAFLLALMVVPQTVFAQENSYTDENNYQQINQDEDYEFIELSREEFIKQIAENNNITYDEAEIKVNITDLKGINDSISRGEITTKGLETKYGYFTSRFYTPSDTNPNPEFSTHAYYGVYASYALPTGSTSWSLRKFIAIHDVFIKAGNGFTKVIVISKNANITSSYNIKFSAIIRMKRDQPLHTYVDYNVNKNFGL